MPKRAVARRSCSVTASWPILAAAAGLVLGAPPATTIAAAEKTTLSDGGLAGHWTLDPARSDDGERAMDVLMPGRGTGPEDGPPPPRERADGRGGAMRPPSGGMRGRGERGAFPRGGERRARLSPEERAALRECLRFALESPATLDVRVADNALVLAYPDGRSRRVVPDGRKHKLEGHTQKASWKDAQLVLETEAGRTKIKESLVVVEDPAILRVDVVLEHPRYDGKLELTRVYLRGVAPAPDAHDTEPDVTLPSR